MGLYWIDEKYLLELSGMLPLFKRKGANGFNHRCPFCGDSKKNPTKARGYHFEYKGGLTYKCHNCGKSCSTGRFIEELDQDVYKRYRMELFKELKGNKTRFRKPRKVAPPTPKKKEGSLLDTLMDSVNDLLPTHKAVKLLNERMIPKDRWNDIYYIDDMCKIGQLKEKYKEKFEKSHEDRLVVAYRNRKGHVVGITCRSFEKDAFLRYIAIPINEDQPQVYGYDRINLKKRVPVLEGAFDSMFIPNSVAVSGSNLKMVDRILTKDQAVLVYDCQPRNKELVRQIEEAIDLGYYVSLLPETGFKDINLMIQGGYHYKEILKMIRENTVRGLKAKLKFNKWKKVDF